MFRCYITQKNSEYTVIQNPLKSNVYSDGFLFLDFEKERDNFLNDFLETSDWRNEVSQSRDTYLQWSDETHFKFTLDLSDNGNWKNTPNGKLKSRRDALASDFLIMEDTNEDKNSPNRFTFWNIQCQYTGKVNYTNVSFVAEKDLPFTYGVQNWFKDKLADKPTLVNLERGISNLPVAYGNENSFDEEFNFKNDIYREVDITPLTTTTKQEAYKNGYLFSISTSTSWQCTLKTNNEKSIASQLYYDVAFDDQGNVKKGKRYDIVVSSNDNTNYPVQDDITYFLYFPSVHANAPWIAFSRLLKSSEYVIGVNAIPFSWDDYAELRMNDTIGNKVNICTANDNGTIETPIEIEGSLIYLPTQQLTRLRLPENFMFSLPKPKLKIGSSKFNKYILNYSDLNVEIKPELIDQKTFDRDDFYINIRNTPQSLSMDLHLPFTAYKGDNVFGIKGLPWDVNNSIPRVVSGNQSTMQNQNQINLQNNINRRNAKETIAGGVVGIVAGIAKAVATPIVGGAMIADKSMKGVVQGAEAANGAGSAGNNIVGNASRMANAKDSIHMQAAQLSDSYNNVGAFNDGTITGLRSASFENNSEVNPNNTMNLTHYQLIEPIYTMCKNYLYEYGSAFGNNLYPIKEYLTHLNGNKFTFVKGSDFTNIYQALKESYSPHEKMIMAATILDGWRGWVWQKDNNPFTYIGDYTLPDDWKNA